MIWYRVRRLVRSVVTSFWFWPVLFIWLAVYLVRVISLVGESVPVADTPTISTLTRGAELYSGVLLTTTAAADITILTFVFSTLMVVLQLASSQLSPRILRTTLREGRAQLSMAIMVGGFVFSLYALSAVYSEDRPLATALLVLGAMLWTIIIVLTFLYFVGYTVTRIRAPAVVRAIGVRSAEDIVRMYRTPPPEEGAIVPGYADSVGIVSPKDGVITGIGANELVRWAARNDALIELSRGLGDHVSSGVSLGHVHSESGVHGSRSVLRALVIEPERTLRGDPPYGFRLLVDIANRSLSPAINDPTTAVQVLDELENLLVLLAEQTERTGRFYDRAGVLRLRVPSMSWADYLRLAVQEIYEYGRESSQVTQRIAAMLDELERVVTGSRLEAVRAVRRQIEVVPPMIPPGS